MKTPILVIVGCLIVASACWDFAALRSVIFNGKYKTLRESLKAAAEFLAPTKLDALKEQVRALAEKL